MLSRRVVAAVTAKTMVLAGMSVVALVLAGGSVPHPAAGTSSHATRAASAGGAATANPVQNVAPSPDYWPTCQRNGASSQTCVDAVVQAIDNARAHEGVAAMVLPGGFASMSPAVQTFVVSNLERVDRGLQPVAGMVAALNATAQTAADNDADPSLSSWTVGSFSANRWGSIWAGDLNALAADYDWMYDDGWGPTGSFNLDCTSATAAGCWGHRDNILSAYGGEQLITGIASTTQSQWTSIAQIFVSGSGSYPPFTHAWSDVSGSGPAAGPTPGADPTTALLTPSHSTIPAGRATTLHGEVFDQVAGLDVPDAAVAVCARPTGAAEVCTPATTDAYGLLTMSVRPAKRTAYRLVFGGSSSLLASNSEVAVVNVKASATLRPGHRASQRWITASLTPAQGQGLRLQRLTSTGWVGVRHSTARHAVVVFGGLGRGTYRLVVAEAAGVLGVVATTGTG